MIRVKQVLNIVKVTPVRTLSSAICAREFLAQSKLFCFYCFLVLDKLNEWFVPDFITQ